MWRGTFRCFFPDTSSHLDSHWQGSFSACVRSLNSTGATVTLLRTDNSWQHPNVNMFPRFGMTGSRIGFDRLVDLVERYDPVSSSCMPNVPRSFLYSTDQRILYFVPHPPHVTFVVALTGLVHNGQFGSETLSVGTDGRVGPQRVDFMMKDNVQIYTFTRFPFIWLSTTSPVFSDSSPCETILQICIRVESRKCFHCEHGM